MSITITDTGLKFSGALTKRSKTTAVVLHHSEAENQGIEILHNYHKNTNGWSGIGYNFYIRLDGGVYQGRGWEYQGAHAGSSSGYNPKSLGICFEGNYETRTSMPAAQFKAGVELIRLAKEKYPGITEILGHRDVAATDCPGKYFPLAAIIEEISKEEDDNMVRYERLSDIPNEHGFRDVVEILMNAGVINGDGSDPTGNNDVIDLSHDQVRSLVFEYRGGAFDKKLIKLGIPPAVDG